MRLVFLMICDAITLFANFYNTWPHSQYALLLFAADFLRSRHHIPVYSSGGTHKLRQTWITLFRNDYVLEGVSKRSGLTNCHFTIISSQISAIYINIFHKTEVQTVILRCWTGLYHNWFKNYDKNEKHVKNAKTPKIAKNSTWILSFLQNRTKTKIEIIAFCVIAFEPIKV